MGLLFSNQLALDPVTIFPVKVVLFAPVLLTWSIFIFVKCILIKFHKMYSDQVTLPNRLVEFKRCSAGVRFDCFAPPSFYPGPRMPPISKPCKTKKQHIHRKTFSCPQKIYTYPQKT